MMTSEGRGRVLALGAACVSGLAVFLNSYAVKHVHASPTTYTTAKNLVAAVVLLAFSALRPRPRLAPPTRRPSVPALIVIGIVGGSVPFILFFNGLAQASSTHAAFLQKTLVVWVAFLAVPLLHERLNAAHVGAIAALLVGQAALGGGIGGIRPDGASMMILGATLLWAVETVLVKRLTWDWPGRSLASARMGVGSVILVGWLTATGRTGQLLHLDRSGWSWVILTGLVLAAYVSLWFAALAAAPAVDVTAVLVFGAVVTAVLSSGFAGAPLAAHPVGLMLVMGGTALALAAGRFPPAHAVPETR
jgi:drug/metabolite transporter (DMT)-like permease